MIDPAALLKDLRGLVRRLEDDIRGELAEQLDVEAKLRGEHAEARQRQRTAMAWEPWRDERVTQSAVAWVLSSTFVRFVEDNGLVGEDGVRLAGPGDALRLARDAQTAYFQARPHDTDRDYLLDAFHRLAVLPGMAPLLDEEHNPLFELVVSPDGASDVLAFWRQQHDSAAEHVALVHDFTDPGWDTRFLGDLYQDLSDAVKKRYALLQTPEFVEELILDRTLERALDTFGLADTHMIDPTCGSGHFLLGGFARLLDRWLAAEPGTEITLLVQKALDRVAGVDLNPYAVAIARFRLLVAALKASGIERLADAPAFRMTLAVGDSLLRNDQGQLFDADDPLSSHTYHTEDGAALDAIFGRPYEVVVGNPPYITVKDKAANANYRQRYPLACHRQYALASPFLQRFFQLARHGSGTDRAGFVGMITANSFMKREFGKKLIEQVLPELDLTTVIDTSGAYIPGHGTPTVILLGRYQRPTLPTVRMALGIRGEPSKPADPAKGLVWQAIVDQLDTPGSESLYISVTDTPRSQLAKHPWSIGGGGAVELKERLEASVRQFLKTQISDSGFGAVTREDDVFMLPPGTLRRARISQEFVTRLVEGTEVRDWSLRKPMEGLWPYDPESLAFASTPRIDEFLWPWRTQLSKRVAYGKAQVERGQAWQEYSMFFAKRFRVKNSIAYAFVATGNHFILDRGGSVFIRTAPVIKLADGASEDEHLRLLGLLNSSVACFWMQQVFHNKGSSVDTRGARQRLRPWEDFYEFDSTKLQKLPVAEGEVVGLARELDALAQAAAEQTPAAVCRRTTPTRAALDAARREWDAIRSRQVALQEELDWRCLHLYGVTDDDLTMPSVDDVPSLALGERAFEIVLARRIEAGDEETVWFTRHRSTPRTDLPEEWPPAYRSLVERRIALVDGNRDVGLVERPENKRRWATEPWAKQEQAALRSWLLDRLESRDLWFDGDHPRTLSVSRLTDMLRLDDELISVLHLYAGPQADVLREVERLVLSDAVPAVAAARYKESGMVKRRVWERTWDLQRREDAGEDVGDIPVPPKYSSADFRSTVYWQARGKLDVPKERFILYPGAERDVDRTPVVGWAGWDHLEQVNAVASLAIERQETEAWDGARLRPLLAAWDEVLPWVRQWHNDPDPRTGRRLGDFYTEHLAVVCQEVGLTTDALRSWEPTRRRGTRTATVALDAAGGDPS